MSTVTKTNMCQRAFKDPQSFCIAKSRESQEDCTHYFKASYDNRCMWYREDIYGACDNWWAQNRKEMPAEIIEILKSSMR